MLTAILSLVAVAIPQKVLLVDPLLVSQAAEVLSLVAKRDNRIWPGWDATKTPLLIYLPGKQDLLINHPKPPAGFVPYEGPIRFPGANMMIKNGPTLITMDGQNTSMEVAGVETLVVADRLSNLRQQLMGAVDQARASQDDMTENIGNTITPDPYGSMLMFAHEAFHVYQRLQAPNKGGNELALTQYPSLSVKNNTGFAMESEALVAALRAPNAAECRKAALQWLALRADRRAALTKESAAYEDGTEFNEGLAKYVEYKAMQVLQGRKPSRDMWLIQGFRGYDAMDAERAKLEDRMRAMMSGKVSINNDPYGASPVRMRLYFSGMGIAGLLDRLGAKWHDPILKPGTTLTTLAADTLKASPAELKNALAEATGSNRYRELTAEKLRLEEGGKKHIQEVLSGFESAPGKVVLDYTAHKTPRVGFAFTPFGVLAIDENRTVFRLIPLRGVAGKLNFSEDSPRPILHDRAKKEVVITATKAIDEGQLPTGWQSGPIGIQDLKLPGITLNGGRATLRLEGKALRVVLADE